MKLFHIATSIAALALSAPLSAQAYDATHDPYATNYSAVADQCSHWAVITPSDSTDLATYPKALWVGGTGDIKMIGAKAPPGASGVTFSAVPGASLMPFRPRRILATGTTASNIVACF